MTQVSNLSNSVENYTYDSVGNRTASHLSATYTNQAFNRLASTTTAGFNYDANGNRISKSEATGNTTYNWDFENRLTQVTNPGGLTVSYQYDALGRRVKRTNGTQVEKFTYDGMNVVLDDDSVYGITTYQNGLGIDNKLKSTNCDTVKYFLQDHLGSTIALADQTGAITAQTGYDSFGNATSYLPTSYQYTGRERDEFSGLTYYRARWYDSNLGRFISEDPIGLAGGFNPFAYVGGNPTNFSDPSGLFPTGSDAATWMDERIDYAQNYYNGFDPVLGYTTIPGLPLQQITAFGLARGFSDMFRVGEGTACAFGDNDENIWGRSAFLMMDVGRAAGIAQIVLGATAPRFSSTPSWFKAPNGAQNTFLPEEYYNNKLNELAPKQFSPYGMYERFDANGNLHQVTTYDGFGSRIRQYDIGPKARHGEGYHVFEYDNINPRQRFGGGRRSTQINF